MKKKKLNSKNPKYMDKSLVNEVKIKEKKLSLEEMMKKGSHNHESSTHSH